MLTNVPCWCETAPQGNPGKGHTGSLCVVFVDSSVTMCLPSGRSSSMTGQPTKSLHKERGRWAALVTTSTVLFPLVSPSSLPPTLGGEHCHPWRTAQPKVLLAFYHPPPFLFTYTHCFLPNPPSPKSKSPFCILLRAGVMGSLAGNFLASPSLPRRGSDSGDVPWIYIDLSHADLFMSWVLSSQTSTEVQEQRQYVIHSYTPRAGSERAIPKQWKWMSPFIHLLTDGWLRWVQGNRPPLRKSDFRHGTSEKQTFFLVLSFLRGHYKGAGVLFSEKPWVSFPLWLTWEWWLIIILRHGWVGTGPRSGAGFACSTRLMAALLPVRPRPLTSLRGSVCRQHVGLCEVQRWGFLSPLGFTHPLSIKCIFPSPFLSLCACVF